MSLSLVALALSGLTVANAVIEAPNAEIYTEQVGDHQSQQAQQSEQSEHDATFTQTHQEPYFYPQVNQGQAGPQAQAPPQYNTYPSHQGFAPNAGYPPSQGYPSANGNGVYLPFWMRPDEEHQHTAPPLQYLDPEAYQWALANYPHFQQQQQQQQQQPNHAQAQHPPQYYDPAAVPQFAQQQQFQQYPPLNPLQPQAQPLSNQAVGHQQPLPPQVRQDVTEQSEEPKEDI